MCLFGGVQKGRGSSHQVIKKQWKHWTWSLFSFFGHVDASLLTTGRALLFRLGVVVVVEGQQWLVCAHRGVGGSHAEVKNSRCLFVSSLSTRPRAAIICTRPQLPHPTSSLNRLPFSFFFFFFRLQGPPLSFLATYFKRRASVTLAIQIEFFYFFIWRSIFPCLLSNFFAYQIIRVEEKWEKIDAKRESLGVNVSIKAARSVVKHVQKFSKRKKRQIPLLNRRHRWFLPHSKKEKKKINQNSN